MHLTAFQANAPAYPLMSDTSTVSDETDLIVPPFARSCMDNAADGWGASFEHPFVKSLADGSLPAAKFRFYQMQDARYLEAFADACSIISTRLDDPDEKLWFIEAARLAIVVEGQLHAGYGAKLGYTADDIRKTGLTPNNRAYQNHMISCALRGSLVEAVAAITPCPWLYTALGQHLESSLGAISDSHPYADWLRTYADPGFVTYTNELLELLQRIADQHGPVPREKARQAFVVSTRYEWMFWDQAWQMQDWPV